MSVESRKRQRRRNRLMNTQTNEKLNERSKWELGLQYFDPLKTRQSRNRREAAAKRLRVRQQIIGYTGVARGLSKRIRYRLGGGGNERIR